MTTFLNTFRSVGGAFEITDVGPPRPASAGHPPEPGVEGGIRFWHPGGELRAVALETAVHPGFMTDWQQPLVVALTQARGLSIVHETVYEQRLGYTTALLSMGATIQTYRDCLGGTPCRFGRRNFTHSAVIAGPTKLHAAELVIPDLRAGFSHLIAALAAEGTSRVYGVDLINRGYEGFEAKLAALGAHTERP
jgi:UDP-N-acetylglucosamine 1-carboxyvinyltransferase